MKKILFLLLSLTFSNSFSQTFLSLDGIETPGGETILLYHYGEQDYRSYAPVYKYNTASGYEDKIMDAFFINESFTRTVQDFEFFPGDTSNFINCGWGYMPDDYGFVAYNDSSVAGFQSHFNYVDISKQNAMLTYAGDGMLNRSFDGGLTYPTDSVLNFNMISVSDFNDNEIFGIDQQNRLIKSFDGGHTSLIVDDLPIYENLYFHPAFYYDTDQMHIYRTNYMYDSYGLFISDDNGNSYTWEMKRQDPEPFVFTNDPSQSGTCYLGYYYHLYKSTNFGENFDQFYVFDERIEGVYPKPETQILYVATQYHLYLLENGTLTSLKEIAPDPGLADYYPLQAGNLWVYNGFIWTYPDYETYQFVRKINDPILKPNQKIYYEVEEYYAGSSYTSKYYERIDTVNTKVYRFNEDSIQSGQEYLLDDLRGEPGDSINSYRFGLNSCTVILSDDTTFYQQETHYKRYYSEFLMGYTYDLVKNFGLTRVYNTFDFGSDERTLKGAIINGILYGDTTVTGINDEDNLMNSFSLSQNYPNPFNPVTTINYSIGHPEHVTLDIYDILGREMITLVNEEKSAGRYTVVFNAENLSSGIYFYQIRAGNFTAARKLTVIK